MCWCDSASAPRHAAQLSWSAHRTRSVATCPGDASCPTTRLHRLDMPDTSRRDHEPRAQHAAPCEEFLLHEHLAMKESDTFISANFAPNDVRCVHTLAQCREGGGNRARQSTRRARSSGLAVVRLTMNRLRDTTAMFAAGRRRL
jgi:hypothetical protein